MTRVADRIAQILDLAALQCCVVGATGKPTPHAGRLVPLVRQAIRHLERTAPARVADALFALEALQGIDTIHAGVAACRASGRLVEADQVAGVKST